MRAVRLRKLCLAIVLLVQFLAATVCRAQSPEQYDRRFDKIWTTLRDKFYDPQMHGLDWEQAAVRYRDKAAASPDRPAFQRTVNQMLAELKASHLYYYTADDFDYYFMRQVFLPDQPAMKVRHIGVMGAASDEGFQVQAILEDSPAANAGLQVGDLLVSTDGKQPFTSAGSFRDKQQAAKVVLRRNGEEQTVDLIPKEQTPVEAFAEATAASARLIERDGKRVGYIHLWCMTHREILRQFEFAIREKLRRTDGLVVDLRDGYGGAIWQFDYVFFQPTMAMQVIPRSGESFIEHHGYHQPLVALINGGSRSAKECFAYELKKTRRARLVGTTTAGYVLGAGGIEIEDDGLLMFPASDLRVDGQRLEGIGVSPHIEIRPRGTYSPDDAQLAGGVDEVLKLLQG